jgi:serine/threonine protein kinase
MRRHLFYKIGHVVGSGSFGQVRKCLHIKSGHIRAVKLISKTHIGTEAQEKVMEELSMLKNMVSHNIGPSKHR